jgi:flagellar biogenesis protein FliO
LGVFANALSFAVRQRQPASPALPHERPPHQQIGVTAWLLDRFHLRALHQPRLALVERIVLAPRQTVALIEADGQRVLVATSAEGAPAFFPLPPKPTPPRPANSRKTAAEGKSL